MTHHNVILMSQKYLDYIIVSSFALCTQRNLYALIELFDT